MKKARNTRWLLSVIGMAAAVALALPTAANAAALHSVRQHSVRQHSVRQHSVRQHSARPDFPQTCSFFHAHLGSSFIAIESWTQRSLAWNRVGNPFPGEPVNLQSFNNSLDQCWRIEYGFGDERFEIQTRSGYCLSENPSRALGAALTITPCRSLLSQQFTAYGSNSVVHFELAEDDGFCVSAYPIQAGSVLTEQNCVRSHTRQWWFQDEF